MNISRPPATIGGTAVVIGASIAGLCAARVLSERFDQVVVLDRDTLPDGPEPRRQVPQGRHPHLLLHAGARLFANWFPGIVAELEEAGATLVDSGRDFLVYQCGGYLAAPASGTVGPAMSRPLLEWTVRKRVASLDNVVIHDRTTVEGLRTDPAGDRITGVTLEDGSTITGSLVVDASGRQARSLAWLADLGYPAPAVSTVEVDSRYLSRTYRRKEDPERHWKAAMLIGDPATKMSAYALPLEDDRWIIALGGFNGVCPPTDDAGMLAYARQFDSPVIADLIATSEPLTDPVAHRFPASRRRHIERFRRFPLGWVLLGDAVCSFNPVYGQGMTAAAQQAEALGRCLDRARTVDRRFARAYWKAAAKTVTTPWSIAVGGDFAYPGTTGDKPAGTDLTNRYFARVMVAAQHDDRIVLRVADVLDLLRPPSALFTPAFIIRVLRISRGGPTGLAEPNGMTTADQRVTIGDER